MDSFFTLLARRIAEAGAPLCIGLDPHPEDLPQPTAAAALETCLRLVDATLPYAAAFKPNAAFFELHGAPGWEALERLIAHIRAASSAAGSRVPVLLDAKRGDIASTAAAYAQAIFGRLGADAVTLNPYLGTDSLTPFTGDPARGVFLLCKTSNPGAADLQDLRAGAGGEPLYIHVARMASALNARDNVGLVVGATQLEALRAVRASAPDLWFLAPGVGAQGGDLEAALGAGLRTDGTGVLVPVARAISRAEEPARAAAALRDRIAAAQSRINRRGAPKRTSRSRIRENPVLAALAGELIDLGCVQFGEFKLKSGLVSPIYIDLRRLVADPQVLDLTAEAFLPLLRELEFDRLAALPYAALPIGTAVSLAGGWPLIYPRKETKDYGTMAEIEGTYEPGEIAVVLDDLITTGGSKFEGIDRLSAAGLVVQDVVVLIDRSTPQTAAELAERGVSLRAVFTLAELLDYWEMEGGWARPENIRAARAFLNG